MIVNNDRDSRVYYGDYIPKKYIVLCTQHNNKEVLFLTMQSITIKYTVVIICCIRDCSSADCYQNSSSTQSTKQAIALLRHFLPEKLQQMLSENGLYFFSFYIYTRIFTCILGPCDYEISTNYNIFIPFSLAIR